jgi:hypothetical protein
MLRIFTVGEQLAASEEGLKFDRDNWTNVMSLGTVV